MGTQIMPCAHAYLLSQRGASAILSTLPLQLPIDLQINTIVQDGAPYEVLRQGAAIPSQFKPRHGKTLKSQPENIYWAEPQLAFQWPEDTTRSVEQQGENVAVLIFDC